MSIQEKFEAWADAVADDDWPATLIEAYQAAYQQVLADVVEMLESEEVVKTVAESIFDEGHYRWNNRDSAEGIGADLANEALTAIKQKVKEV